MGKIYITRHGETEWNTVRRMQGQNNSPLTQLGENQANWLAKRLENEPIDIIYSSSLVRAINTAYLLKGDRDIKVIPKNELREIYLGSWQSCLIEDVKKAFPMEHNAFWNAPEHYIPIDGESFEALTARVQAVFQEILDKHPNDNVLIVAHAIVLKALVNSINYKGATQTLWEGPHFHPTCLTLLSYEKGELSFEFIADTSHYETAMTTGSWFIEEED